MLREVLSRREIVRAVRGYAEVRGCERFSIKEFTKGTGIPESQIYREFESWGELREAAGLERRLKFQPWFTEEELLEELHRVAMKLKRIPTWHEFSRHARMGWQVMHRRFGGKRAVLDRYKKWLEEKAREIRRRRGAEPEPRNIQQPRADEELDSVYVRRAWQALRVGCELRSSDFKGMGPEQCDLLVVMEHDWKGCPVPVIELHKVSEVEADRVRRERRGKRGGA